MFVLFSVSPEISYLDLKVHSCNVFTEVIKIEYALIDGQWWKIIYYSDGNIEIQMSQSAGD